MNRYLLGVLPLAAMLALSPLTAHAEDAVPPPPEAGALVKDAPTLPPPDEAKAWHHKVKKMTPEEREAHKAKMKEKFDSLPPEKQAEIKAKRAEWKAKKAEMQEKLKNMTPEEREAFKKKWREEHGWKHHKGKKPVTQGADTPAPVTGE